MFYVIVSAAIKQPENIIYLYDGNYPHIGIYCTAAVIWAHRVKKTSSDYVTACFLCV